MRGRDSSRLVKFGDYYTGVLLAVVLVLTVLLAGGMYTKLNWLTAVLLSVAAVLTYRSQKRIRSGNANTTDYVRGLMVLFLLVTGYLLFRYSLCQWYGDFESRLPVGAHWLGPPVSLAAFVSSWSLWMFCILSFFVASLLSRRNVLIMGWVFVSLVLFEAVYGFMAYRVENEVILGVHPRESVKDVAGTFVNRNLFAAFMAIATPFGLASIYLSRRISLVGRMFSILVVSMIATMAVVESHSRLGFVAYIAGVGLVGWRVSKEDGTSTKKRTLILLAALVVMLIVFLQIGGDVILHRFMQLPSATARIQIWSTVFEIPFSYWFLGIGPGNTDLVMRQLLPSDFDPFIAHLHNEPVQFLLEFGIVFSGLLIIVISRWFTRAKRAKHHGLQIAAQCSLYAGLISACGDYPYRMPGLSITCCILLGIIANERLLRRAKTQSSSEQ